jgi:hypothetical protein
MTDKNDEIAILALQCIRRGRAKCSEAIELNIATAVAGGRWDEMNKWHRVRLRARRLQQEQSLTQDLSMLKSERPQCVGSLRPA